MSEVRDDIIDNEDEIVHDDEAVYDEDYALHEDDAPQEDDDVVHDGDVVYEDAEDEDYPADDDSSAEHTDADTETQSESDNEYEYEYADEDERDAEHEVESEIEVDAEEAEDEEHVYKRGDDYSDAERKIREELDNLDMITISAIAIMISGTNQKASSPFIEDLRKADIKDVLLTFLEDTYNLNTIGEIDDFFNKKYYKKIIRKYLRSVTVHVRRGISDSLPRKNMWLLRRMKMSSQRSKIYIDKICETVKSFESVKFIPALSGNQEASISKRNYKLDHLSDHYKDALIYLVDVLLTCTCISKMMFVERMVKRIPDDSEFLRIIGNMIESIRDINVIINKSRPIYKQFYQAELGNIDGDDLLYGMAVTIIVNNITKTGIMNKDLLKLEFSFDNAGELTNNMMLWLDFLAKYDYTTEIGSLILQRISLLVKGNSDLLLAGLGEFLNLEDFFEKRIAYYRKLRDKERYLKGDLTKEVLEMATFSDYAEEV